MQTKSEHKNGTTSQKRNNPQPNQQSKNIKEQSSKEQRLKNHSRAIPPLNNSPSYKKIPVNSSNIHQQQIDPPSLSNSNASRPRNSQSFVAVDRVVQLHQRLKNLHLFYKTRIQEQKARAAQRNEVFIGIIEEMQRSHNQKIIELRKMIEESQSEKKDVGLVDERMNEIKGSIDEILKQSNDLKESNQRLQHDIEQKQNILKQKQEQLSKLKEQLMESRNQLQSFERLNLKQNKRNKEIVGMIQKTENNFNRKYNQ